jgi:hypothetical protein
MGRACSRNEDEEEEEENASRLFMGNPEGRRPVGRPRSRLVDNFKMNIGEIGWGGVNLIRLARSRYEWGSLVSAVISLRITENAGKLSSGFTTGGLSSSAQLHRVSLLVISAHSASQAT